MAGEESFGYSHDGFSFFDLGVNFGIFIPFRGDDGSKVFEGSGEIYSTIIGVA